jgi:hypothetical protein
MTDFILQLTQGLVNALSMENIALLFVIIFIIILGIKGHEWFKNE